jgi:mono/diheme cytochrome c family protein
MTTHLRSSQSTVRRLILTGLVTGLFGSAARPDLRAAVADPHRSLFINLCAPCHGPDGRARTPAARKLVVKDLTQSRISDPEIRQQILEGRRDKDGRQQMPGFSEKLSPDQVAGLVAMVKKFRGR